MAATLGWRAFADTNIDNYLIFRSITGIKITFPNALVAGDVFSFAATSPTPQQIAFPAVDIDSVIATINANANGLQAALSDDGLSVYVRCTARRNPKLKINPCTFAAHLGITTPALIAPQQNFVQVGTVAFLGANLPYSFTDADGGPLDWYTIVSQTGSNLSLPSVAVQPILAADSICIVEGRVADLKNRPIVNALVRVQLQVPPRRTYNTGIDKKWIITRTDKLGRWSIAVQRRQLVIFQIPAVGYNEIVRIPHCSAVLFKHLKPVDDHFYDNTSGEELTLEETTNEVDHDQDDDDDP